MGRRLRRNFSLSPAIDARIRERAKSDGDGHSRAIERFIFEADGNQDALRHQLRSMMHNVIVQCAVITNTTRQPKAIEAVISIERSMAAMSAKLATR